MGRTMPDPTFSVNPTSSSRIKNFFINPDENRLRAGWRILIFWAILMALSVSLQLLIRFVFGGLPHDPAVKDASRALLIAIVATIAVVIARRYIDKKPIVSLGLAMGRQSWLDLIFGFALSGLMVGAVFLILMSLGWLDVTQVMSLDTSGVTQLLLGFVAVGLTVGWWEELAFRGMILQNMEEGLGLAWAIGISCVIYGVIHMINPNANWLSGLIIALIGYLRIFGYLRTRQLWLSMGMHAGWNFFQGPVFGFGVSGLKSKSLVQHELSGPDWFTGGVFGPEAGLLCVAVVLLALGAMWLWTRGRDDSAQA